MPSKVLHYLETGEIIMAPPPYARHSNNAVVAMHNAILHQYEEEEKTPSAEDEASLVTKSPRKTLPSDIDHLFTSRPFHLQSAFDTIADHEDGSGLEAVQHLTAALDLSTSLRGENQTILEFKAEPLSYSLRITKGTSSSIYIHNDAEVITQEFPVTSEADLKAIAQCILSYKAELESGRGNLRPVPRSDSVLLAVLDEKRWDEERVPWFAEAQRAISRGSLLDATTELLTPFGMQPRESNVSQGKLAFDLLPKKEVREQHQPMDIVIERLDKRFCPPASQDSYDSDEESDSTYGSQDGRVINTDTAVIITQLKTSSYARITEDRKREPMHFLHGKGVASKLDIDDLPKGLIYDLSNHGDVVAFVSRVLAGRNEIRAEYIMPFEIRCARHGWSRKQKSPEIAAASQNHVRVLACRARKTNLHAQIMTESLLEEEKKEEQAARKAAQLEREMHKFEAMRRDWRTRADAVLDSLVEKIGDERRCGQFEADQGSMSWADMVEEDLGEMRAILP
jgi:hypothetical protein